MINGHEILTPKLTRWPQSTLFDQKSGSTRYIGLPQRDLIASHLAQVGAFEGELLNKAAELLANKTLGAVLDVGANLGSFSLPLAGLFPHLHFTCFEAQRMVAYQLAGAAALNGLANLHIHHAAVSDRRGSMQIAVPDYDVETNIGALSLDPHVNTVRGACSIGAVETVTVLKLDDIQMRPVILLKIDVEGMELAVLQGAEVLLERNNFPPIICECWGADWFKTERVALRHWFARHHYAVTELGENWQATRTSTSR